MKPLRQIAFLYLFVAAAFSAAEPPVILSLRQPSRKRLAALVSPVPGRPIDAVILPAAYLKSHPLGELVPHLPRLVAAVSVNDAAGEDVWKMDFADSVVRSRFVARCRSAAADPAVHAIFLDFLDEPAIFPSARLSGSTSPAQCALIVDLVRAVKAEVGRPIWIHAPDSPALARAMGIDLPAILPYVALYAAGGRFHLEHWKVPAALAAAHRVPFVPVLDPHGFSFPNDQSSSAPDNPLLMRYSAATYRARLALLPSDVAAVILVDPPDVPYGLHHRFFVTYRNPRALVTAVKDGRSFAHLPILARPVSLPATYPVELAGVVSATSATLVLEIDLPRAFVLRVVVNGHLVSKLVRRQAGIHTYSLPVAYLRDGSNEVALSVSGVDTRGRRPVLRAIAIELNPPPDP